MSCPEATKAEKLAYTAPSLTTHMIMKSEKPEEEENLEQRDRNIEKICPANSQASNLPSYYRNGMPPIGRLGML